MIETFDPPIARSFLTDVESGVESKNEGEVRPSPLILPLTFQPAGTRPIANADFAD